MAHNHGYEYQVRAIRGEGNEELSGWMHSPEDVVGLMSGPHRPQGKSYWLMVRNITCSDCTGREQIMEHPMLDIPSPRCTPHDTRYLQAVESRNRCTSGTTAARHAP